MSDIDESNLEAKIDIDMNKSSFTEAETSLSHIEKVWNKLANLPSIDLDSKLRAFTIGKKTSQEDFNRLFSSDRGAIAIGKKVSSEDFNNLFRAKFTHLDQGLMTIGRKTTPDDLNHLFEEKLKLISHHKIQDSKPNITLPSDDFFNSVLSTIRGNKKESKSKIDVQEAQEEIKENETLSYTWDSLFNQELNLLKSKDKQEAILSVLDKDVHEKMKYVAASSTGAYHPEFAHNEGGLLRHSKAVAQAAYNLAGMTGYKGDTDALIGAAITHDMWKLGLEGEKQFTDPKHPTIARDVLKSEGLKEEGELVESHMGNMFSGQYKNAPKVTTEGQKLLHEADWYMSRPYAQDYVKWDSKGNIASMDMPGLMSEAEKRNEHPMLDAEDPIAKSAKGEKDAAKEAKNRENSWFSILSSAKKLVALLAAGGLIGKFISSADKGVTTGASLILSGMSTFTGLTNKQILDNQMREAKAMMPTGTISNVLMKLQEKRGTFKTIGTGDLLWDALSGDIGNLMTGKKPMEEVYGEAVNRYIKLLSNTKDQTKREQYQTLIGNTFGPEMLGFVNYGVSQGTTWEGMAARTSPEEGLGNWTKDIVSIKTMMTEYKLGIHDSMMSLYSEFETIFGVPFLAWWDGTLRKMISSAFQMDRQSQLKREAGSDYMKLIKGTDILLQGDTSLAKEYDIKRKTDLTKPITDYLQGSRAKEIDTAVDYLGKFGTNIFSKNKITRKQLQAVSNQFGLGHDYSSNKYKYKDELTILAELQEELNRLKQTELKNTPEGKSAFNLNPDAIYFPNTAENTAKAVEMFRFKYSNQKKYAPIIDMLSHIRDANNPDRLPDNAIDSVIPGLLKLIDENAKNIPLVEPILKKLQDPDISSNKGAATVNLAVNFPNAKNAQEIEKGITSAINSIPTAIDNAYLSLYAAG